MNTISLTIDGVGITAPPGTTVLRAASDADIYIPGLCEHRDLSPVGACGMCVVEIEGIEGVVRSCATPVREGMIVSTKSERLTRIRRLSLELLLSAHPEECSSCPKYLRCEMQNLTQYLSANPARLRRRINLWPVNGDNPLFIHDFSRCILCERCVRACGGLRGVGVLQVIKEDGKVHIGLPDGKTLAEAGCRFCGACAEVCPTGALRDKEELIDRTANRRKEYVPCAASCPAGIDIPRYVRLVREGKPAAAAAVVREKVPFPAVLGYICSHECETGCRRGYVNEAVSIKALKRYAAERDDGAWKSRAKQLLPTGKRVAVIGSGPAGLTAAYYLSKQGHAVTVFEALPAPGGLLRYGIPRYRLPEEVLDREIAELVETGVTIETGVRIESAPALLDRGFDAVLAAVGTTVGTTLPIDGADLEGILVNIPFLRAAAQGAPEPVGKRVAVLGGGNVAFDCAGVARRLGAEEVHVICLEPRDKMTASAEEIAEALAEGTIIHNSRTFLRIMGMDPMATGTDPGMPRADFGGRVTGVECAEVRGFSFDGEGRISLETADGPAEIIPADTVIFAVGQRPDLTAGFGLELGKGNRIVVNGEHLSASVPGVFAAGDGAVESAESGSLTQPPRLSASVVGAVASGRKAAVSIDLFLGGDGDIDEDLVPKDKPEGRIGRMDGFAALSRRPEPREGFESDGACGEASRCLQCDLRLEITTSRFWNDYPCNTAAAPNSEQGLAPGVEASEI